MSPSVDQASQSGIITSSTGERHIPSSQRPDGTTRREIKIRPGYRPAEDVETYKNRTAEAWKTRGTGGVVPGAAVEGEEDERESKTTSGKNAKRREARRKAKSGAAAVGLKDGDTDCPATAATAATEDTNAVVDAPREEAKAETEAATEEEEEKGKEKEKEARKLQKKLRQARELREKKDSGGNLLPEQFEKVIKINELIRQLKNLGYDADDKLPAS